MASILIPMGFQFLTVLGSKSLLMSKMALIMSAITGLKKFTSSHGGHYHDYHDHHDHHHGFHDKMYQLNSHQKVQQPANYDPQYHQFAEQFL